jgi:hypothetical protein
LFLWSRYAATPKRMVFIPASSMFGYSFTLYQLNYSP